MDVLTLVKRNRVVLPLACAAAMALVVVSETSYWRSAQTLDTLKAIGDARFHIQSLERNILDAETGQRGYLLTNRPEYLQPYEAALGKIGVSFTALDTYYRHNPESHQALQQLHGLMETKLSELALTLELHNAGKTQAGNEILLSDIGKEKMEAIRSVSAELLAFEVHKTTASQGEIYNTLLFSRLGVAALSGISLLALYLYLRQSFALKEQQHNLQRVLQDERDRLEREVVERTAQLTDLAQHLQTAREDERNRLARNLHDDLGSLLTSAKLDAARIKSRLSAAAPEALDLLAHLVGTLNSGIALGRRIIEDLRPSALSNLGLVSTLEILAREFADSTEVQVHTTLVPVALTPAAELMVYRLVQEAITNITKYAKAQQVWITLDTQAGEVSVSVRDDGAGFNTSAKPQSAYGLVGMRYRVEAEGGVLTLASTPGQGTLVQARLPASAIATA